MSGNFPMLIRSGGKCEDEIICRKLNKLPNNTFVIQRILPIHCALNFNDKGQWSFTNLDNICSSNIHINGIIINKNIPRENIADLDLLQFESNSDQMKDIVQKLLLENVSGNGETMEKLKNQEREIQEIKQNLNEKEQENEEIRKKLNEKGRENEELKKKLNEKERRNEELIQKLNERDRENEEIMQELESENEGEYDEIIQKLEDESERENEKIRQEFRNEYEAIIEKFINKNIINKQFEKIKQIINEYECIEHEEIEEELNDSNKRKYRLIIGKFILKNNMNAAEELKNFKQIVEEYEREEKPIFQENKRKFKEKLQELNENGRGTEKILQKLFEKKHQHKEVIQQLYEKTIENKEIKQELDDKKRENRENIQKLNASERKYKEITLNLKETEKNLLDVLNQLKNEQEYAEFLIKNYLLLRGNLKMQSNKNEEITLNLKKSEENLLDVINQLKNEQEHVKLLREEIINRGQENQALLLRELESELECSICNEIFIGTTTLNCKHSYCNYCIVHWQQTKNNCPICRKQIEHRVQINAVDSFINKIFKSLSKDMQKKRLDLINGRSGSL